MSDSASIGEFRICPSCGSRNKAAHNYCVRCSASLRTGAAGPALAAGTTSSANLRIRRFLIAAGGIAAISAGFVVHAVSRATQEVSAITEEVRADSARTVGAAPLPPPVAGWTPGANVPVDSDTAPRWSSESFPVARPNPYDVPGDPNASMVGIAPRSPRVRAAMSRQRVFTENDLLATRGGSWSTPAPEPVRTQAPPDTERSEEVAKRETKLDDARSRLSAAQQRLHSLRARGEEGDLEDAADDVDDAQRDAAKAIRKLEEARRRN